MLDHFDYFNRLTVRPFRACDRFEHSTGQGIGNGKYLINSSPSQFLGPYLAWLIIDHPMLSVDNDSSTAGAAITIFGGIARWLGASRTSIRLFDSLDGGLVICLLAGLFTYFETT